MRGITGVLGIGHCVGNGAACACERKRGSKIARLRRSVLGFVWQGTLHNGKCYSLKCLIQSLIITELPRPQNSGKGTTQTTAFPQPASSADGGKGTDAAATATSTVTAANTGTSPLRSAYGAYTAAGIMLLLAPLSCIAADVRVLRLNRDQIRHSAELPS